MDPRSVIALQFELVVSPVGPLFLAETEEGPAAVWFADHRYEESLISRLSERYPEAALTRVRGTQLAQRLERYFEGNDERVVPPPWISGSPFERAVWREIASIPLGFTITYGEIARRLESPHASRAVGLATGRNPIAILIPCHRVIGSDGDLVGYGGGLERKRWLLAHESGDLFPRGPMH